MQTLDKPKAYERQKLEKARQRFLCLAFLYKPIDHLFPSSIGILGTALFA